MCNKGLDQEALMVVLKAARKIAQVAVAVSNVIINEVEGKK